MDPIMLQKMLKNNHKDLQNFCEDLKNWGDEMKRKNCENTEDNSKSRISEKKTKSIEKCSSSTKKVMTYSDWEKYDAEKECEKLDKNENSSNDEDEKIEAKLKESAIMEKESGNKYVKTKNWKKALECYTKAIDYHPYDPVFYANRALCYLKLNEFSKAENDCTVSLKLDSSYVKAYQRRAAAREAQKKYQNAINDYLTVLNFEPKNTESSKKLEDLKKIIENNEKEARPISVFTASRNQKKDIDEQKPKSLWPSGEQNSLVRPIDKPPHLRSKKPRKIIEIHETNSSSWPKTNNGLSYGTLTSDDLKIIEKKENIDELITTSENKKENMETIETEKMAAPKTSVQFYSKWKQLNKEQKIEYLKLIQPQKIPNLFKESLESHVFSEILFILSEFPEKNEKDLYEYLNHLSKIKRFSTLVMFLMAKEKELVSKMLKLLKENGHNSEEIDELIIKYEL